MEVALDDEDRIVTEPYPEGTRVHHCGAIYSLGNPENPGGWGTVKQSVEQHDKTFEYEVEVTSGLAGGEAYPEPETSWWGSHHIDRAVAAEVKGNPVPIDAPTVAG